MCAMIKEDNTYNRRYDEDEAIAFIRRHISTDAGVRCSDDDIIYVIDTIWDYYESKGYVSLDSRLTPDEEKKIEALIAFVRREVGRDDEVRMNPEDVEYIVKGELSYEKSIELADD